MEVKAPSHQMPLIEDIEIVQLADKQKKITFRRNLRILYLIQMNKIAKSNNCSKKCNEKFLTQQKLSNGTNKISVNVLRGYQPLTTARCLNLNKFLVKGIKIFLIRSTGIQKHLSYNAKFTTRNFFANQALNHKNDYQILQLQKSLYVTKQLEIQITWLIQKYILQHQSFSIKRRMQSVQNCYDPIPQKEEAFSEQRFTISMIDTACGYSFCHKNQIKISKTDVFSMSKFSTSVSFFKRGQISKVRPYQQQLRKIRELYKDHKLDQAYQVLNEAFKSYFKNSSFKNLDIARTSFYQNLQFSQSEIQFLKLVEEQYSDLKSFDKELLAEGWVEKSNKKGMKISTKRGSDNVGVLVECVLSVPIEIFLTVLTEIDLMKNFIPFMEQSQTVKSPARNCRIGYGMNNFPILSKRQALFDGIGYDRLNHNSSIFLYTRSIHNRPDLLKRYGLTFEQKKNTVMIEYKYLILEYTPIDREKGYLKFAANTDMKISVPMFLLQMATEGFGFDLVNNILKVSQKFKGSPWEAKMKQNPDFFRYIQQRQEQYWRQIQNKNGQNHA